VARTGLEHDDGRSGAWHRVLVYFGLADSDDLAKPPHEQTAARLSALEQRVDENAREIAALRGELDRLRSR
jgi:hypothetical protein